MAKITDPQMQPLSKDFVQPQGFPDTTTVNDRVSRAVARLQVRGQVPQPNPLVTAWQLHALIRVLARLGIIDQAHMDEISYFTAHQQMQDLERIADEAHRSPLIVAAAAAAPKANDGH